MAISKNTKIKVAATGGYMVAAVAGGLMIAKVIGKAAVDENPILSGIVTAAAAFSLNQAFVSIHNKVCDFADRNYPNE